MDKLDLYLTHRTKLIEFAAPIVGSRTSAEDVVQEAWFRFSAAAADQRGAEQINQPVAYLYRIVRNLAIDLVRRSRHEVPPESSAIVFATIPAATPSPEDQVLHRDEIRVVEKALAELPERTRTAFELHRLRGHTLKETAAAIGVSVTRTHQLVCDALTHCANRLDTGDGSEESPADEPEPRA